MRTCTKCEAIKPLTEFHPRPEVSSGLRRDCKTCVNTANREYARRNKEQASLQQKAWRDRNPERVRKNITTWAKSNPDKRAAHCAKWRKANLETCAAFARNYATRKRGSEGYHTGEQVRARFEYFGNKCLGCGTTERLEADHNIPVSKGGPNWASNIVPLCRSCNASKSAKTLKEFLSL
jgi:5-methylcytosine-specific restriction endonuclease McrA